MSLKGVELQIAIPKTFDAGKMADQAAQLSQGNQSASSEAMKRQVVRNRSTVTTSENTKAIDGDDENQNQEFEQPREKSNNKNEAIVKINHPFKGNFVDFSG